MGRAGFKIESRHFTDRFETPGDQGVLTWDLPMAAPRLQAAGSRAAAGVPWQPPRCHGGWEEGC